MIKKALGFYFSISYFPILGGLFILLFFMSHMQNSFPIAFLSYIVL